MGYTGPLPMAKRVGSAWIAPTIMALGVVTVYWPPPITRGTIQVALDYWALHVHRMEFARQALLSKSPHLPAWYPREAMGTPFWSNIQSFPFLPTRLLILLLDPKEPHTFAIACIVAALAAALFTFLLGRRLGLGAIAAAAAGWTFACSGFFAGRVTAGHLPLLEVFASLPMMLWAVESYAQEKSARRLFALGACSCVVLLGGHPQLPVYALAVAVVFIPVRCGLARARWGLAALSLGAGCASFVWIPMLRLIGRSTRVLSLAPAGNDVPLPWDRIASFWFPWIDGAPEPLGSSIAALRSRFPPHIFWDTTAYAGWAPWLALLGLGALALSGRRPISLTRSHKFVLITGAVGLALALPWFSWVAAHLPGTYLRSPSRLLYLMELALAIGLGIAVEQLSKDPRSLVRRAVPLLLLLHAFDLGSESRKFIFTVPSVTQSPEQEAGLAGAVGEARVAIDCYLPLALNRRVDDVGFFDSIILARPYRTLLDWAAFSSDFNTELLFGSVLPRHVLEGTGVKWVVTLDANIKDLKPVASKPFHVYEVEQTMPRAAFYPLARTRWLEREALHSTLRNAGSAALGWLLLPGADPEIPRDSAATLGPVEYRRSNSDAISCGVNSTVDGHVVVLESFDEGWSAHLDGQPAKILPAMDAWLAVKVPPGRHEIELRYRTDGAFLGLALSALALAGLTVLVAASRRCVSAER